ncbi:mechanosensitive ion channel [Sphingomonas sp. JC676]|uniref:cyclic nucleotide-binding domain-containing protein n=1 Tax=Sphingomonas sp. JC676 TaxID=2768065 RepID=UPI00165832D3|nr:mechanosensitive ion channel family protein [Sphingomonas sp. JC676]MBC9031844.1 mechanosensitive ion channel [Sphingomonas sp. JC676]
MNFYVVTLPLLAATSASLLIVRSRSAPVRLAVEILLLVAVGAELLWQGISPLPRTAELPSGNEAAWLRALAVLWWLIGARVVVTALALLKARDSRARQARLFSDLLAAAIYLTVVLIVLNSVLDLPVNGLLATSGVIAIVLGLALQNTLADVFSGIAVGVEQPFHVGDRVSLGDHIEGVVVQMNWRAIRIQTDDNDLATIPNSVAAKAQIINRSVPTERRTASVEITVASPFPPDRLIELMRQALLLCPGILSDPAPWVYLTRLGLRSCTYTIGFVAPGTKGLAATKSQLLRQAHRLLHHAGAVTGEPLSHASLLRELALFEGLDATQIENLAVSLASRRVGAGEQLFEQGSSGLSFFIVKAGVLEISRNRFEDQSESIGRVGPGEYLGEVSVLTGEPRRVTATAVADSEVLELPGAALEKLIAETPGLAEMLGRSVQRGLARLDRDEAARIAHPLDTSGKLFERIKAIFRL